MRAIMSEPTTEPAEQTEYRIVFEASGTVAQGTATVKAQAIRTMVEAGFEPKTAVAIVAPETPSEVDES
jgi:hypothetical protein